MASADNVTHRNSTSTDAGRLSKTDQFARKKRLDPPLIVQYDVQQRAMHLQLAVVLDEAKLAKLVHKVVHPGTRRADHLCQRFLADFCNYAIGLALLPEVRQQKQHARQPLFAGIEK